MGSTSNETARIGVEGPEVYYATSQGNFLQPSVNTPQVKGPVDWTTAPGLTVKLPYWNVLAWLSDVYFGTLV